jgi:hypothetical protein
MRLRTLSSSRTNTFAGMVRRRATFNPLETTSAPRWYVVRTMHGSVIESRELSPGADLKHVFVTAMLAWMDGGWQIGEFSSNSGTFFCTRAHERRAVSIVPIDPYDVPMYRATHLGGCDNFND